jgi:hypothetical protein
MRDLNSHRKAALRGRFVLVALAATLAVLATAPARADDWVVRVDGAGPLKVGMKFDTVNQVLGDHMARPPAESRGSSNCFYVRTTDDPRIMLMFVDDVLRRVDAQEEGVRSERGVRVGDPVARVGQAYGEAVQEERHAYDDAERYLTIRTGGGQYAMRFETGRGRIVWMYAGYWTQVQMVEACS